jgi:hypothetical protein
MAVKHYILYDRKPIQVSLEKAIDWSSLHKQQGVVAETWLPGKIRISTCFIGFALFYDEADFSPELFETIVFDETPVRHQVKYKTWEEAERGHEEVVKMIERAKNLS